MKVKRIVSIFVLTLIFACLFPVVNSQAGLLDDLNGVKSSGTEASTTADENSITGVMKNWGSTNTPDSEYTQAGSSWISEKFGMAISVGVVLLFAFLMLTTAIDFVYICFPALRSTLYSGASGVGQSISPSMPVMNQAGQQGTGTKTKQFISPELRKLVDAQVNVHQRPTTKSFIVMYLKDRIIALILITVCVILLMSSVFTDFGMNVGKYLFYVFGF